MTQILTLNPFFHHTGAAVLCANRTRNTTLATQVQTPPTSFPKREPTKICPQAVGTLLAVLHNCSPLPYVSTQCQVCSRGHEEVGLTPSFPYSQGVSDPEEKGRWWLLLKLVGIFPTMRPAGTLPQDEAPSRTFNSSSPTSWDNADTHLVTQQWSTVFGCLQVPEADPAPFIWPRITSYFQEDTPGDKKGELLKMAARACYQSLAIHFQLSFSLAPYLALSSDSAPQGNVIINLGSVSEQQVSLRARSFQVSCRIQNKDLVYTSPSTAELSPSKCIRRWIKSSGSVYLDWPACSCQWRTTGRAQFPPRVASSWVS